MNEQQLSFPVLQANRVWCSPHIIDEGSGHSAQMLPHFQADAVTLSTLVLYACVPAAWMFPVLCFDLLPKHQMFLSLQNWRLACDKLSLWHGGLE